jgi:hypothetical protein
MPESGSERASKAVKDAAKFGSVSKQLVGLPILDIVESLGDHDLCFKFRQ